MASTKNSGPIIANCRGRSRNVLAGQTSPKDHIITNASIKHFYCIYWTAILPAPELAKSFTNLICLNIIA